MSSAQVENLPGGTFRVLPEHNPKSKPEKYRRLHYYVSRMGVAVSDCLMESLLIVRRTAYQLSGQELQTLALKGYSDEEYCTAVKELLCIWLHQEAMDQGGKEAIPWILSFLRLAFGATDILIARPRARDVLSSYGFCETERELCLQTAMRASQALGFGKSAPVFAPTIEPILLNSLPVRQGILKDALTLPLDVIDSLPIT